MCGIFGVLTQKLEIQQKEKLVLNALSLLDHRGPDAWGIYNSPSVCLGHTRLSIIDVNEGHQPMRTSRSVISFNGEIYNYIELRQQLESSGVQFRTQSDTEVILKLYETEGLKCLDKLNGQFAFLIWDKQDQRLVVARDRYGIRPLYILEYKGDFYFSSEMKAFDVIDEHKREFCPDNLYEHALLWNTLSDRTVYKGIRSVEAGTYEVFTPTRRLLKERFYQIGESFNHEADPSGFEETKEQFRDLLTDSVKLRLRSDVPVGTYLSGGIDSTVISQLVKNATLHQFKTFSVAFDDISLDESKYQEMASKQIGSIHHKVNITGEDIDHHISKSVYHIERPIFRTAPVPLHLLSRSVSNTDIKVVLSGEGADEILFGYDTYKELKILDDWKSGARPSDVSEAIRNLYPHLNHYKDKRQFGLIKMYYEGFLDKFENDFCGLNIRVANNKYIERFFNPDHKISYDENTFLENLKQILPDGYHNWSLLRRNFFLEIKTLLQGYLLSSQGDRMAMSNGVECRFPFLDHRIVELAFNMPDEYKLNGYKQKYILRETFKSEIAEEIIDRPKRPYMAPDLIAFIRPDGRMTDIASEMLSSTKIEQYGLFNFKVIDRFLKKFKNGVPENTGYRDNMVFIFLLTSQLCCYWIDNTNQSTLDWGKCVVNIVEDR